MSNILTQILQKRDATERELSRDARGFAELLSRKLEQLNICYRYRKNEKDWMERGTQRVKFTAAVTQEEAIWLRIDTSPRRFPRGVSLAHIENADVLNDLSVSVGRPVHFRRSDDGAYLMIERESGVFGIKQIDFADVMTDEQWSKLVDKPLYLPLGLGHNRKVIYRSLADFPHALVGGATMSGKTTLLHTWICTLALKNKPQLLRMVLMDLKGGVEFTRYKKLPHLWTYEKEDGTTFNGFIKARDDVVPVLEILRGEMDRRLAMFESAGGGSQHIAAWNHHHRREPLARIVVFIDELASIMLEPDLKKDAERLLSDLGARGRATGFHLILATQRPEVSVVSGRIKGNLDARFAFRVPDNTSSMVILDDISAAKFSENTPRGRYIYKLGNDRKELQGPWIGPNKIKALVAAIIDGDIEMQTEAVKIDPLEVFKVALAELNGEAARDRLFKLMRGKISMPYLVQILRDYEGEVIEIDGALYELMKPKTQFEPRKLIRVSAQETDISSTGIPDDTPQIIPQTAIVHVTALPEISRDPTRFIPEDALRWAIENTDGFISCKKIYQQFKRPGLTYNEVVAQLAEYEGATVELDGALYFCEPSAGRRPRRLIKVED